MSTIIRRIFPKSLSQEVIEVFAASPAIKKLGHNDEDDYDYLMILTLCQNFKMELFERGIVFTATDVDCLFEQISEGKDGFTVRCTVRTKFEARRECWFGTQRFNLGEALGAGLDMFDHIALAVAQTFAFKAMLKRSSMTYGVKDDPEATRQGTFRNQVSAREQVRLASHQRRSWDAAVHKSGLSKERISDELSTLMGFPIECDDIPGLPEKDFENLMTWILKHEDLSEQWTAALEAEKNKRRGPQAIVTAINDPRPDEIAGD